MLGRGNRQQTGWSLRNVISMGLVVAFSVFLTSLTVVATSYVDPSLYTDFMATLEAPIFEVSVLDIVAVVMVIMVIGIIMTCAALMPGRSS